MDRLARHGVIAPDAEQVVHELECQAQMLAEATQLLDLLRAAASGQGAECAGTPQQRAGLPLGHAEALGPPDVRPLLEGEVGALTVEQLQHRGGEYPQLLPCGGMPAAGE